LEIRIVQSAHNSGLEEGACRVVKNIGKTDAGKLHVRFDEGGQGKTCSLLYPTAPKLKCDLMTLNLKNFRFIAVLKIKEI